MSQRRKNFTNLQKAEIFVLDHAMCSFSGKNLWLLDYGAAPSMVDWVDHKDPASRGGLAEVDNGACACWLYNYGRGNNRVNVYMFRRGQPTADFVAIHETVPVAFIDHISRFTVLHWSDWYFNRAVFNVLLAAAKGRRKDGGPFKRDADYRANAAMNFLETWATGATETTSFKDRGLLLPSPYYDQISLQSLGSVSSATDVKNLIENLVPYVDASWGAMDKLCTLTGLKEARTLLREVLRDKYVVPRTKNAVRTNIERLYLKSAA